MLKKIALLIVGLVALVPACGLLGYAIGYLIAMFVFSATLEPHTYEHDRDLFAAIYGIMFIGGFLYAVAAGFAIFRFVRSFRKG
ncbi:hypothetical protein EQ718_16740 (plasmid) [Paracoccus versutus]|uniref:Uncharacterized protein n=1 Tax=Paracoccus versutus TaxID=34007 RepID=A0AAQ0KLK5_PARVE|nr:hypothetical protein [Paracoccus versutus]KGJ12109.1 hypothetical protein IT40_03405 [Paracoccus versutus]REG44570.1 hypothetical protein ATH84_102239 [Paracoccus versutus]WEJ80526.1 hypothetical protein EQ718_16740 [Paracoccus versutus]